MVKLMATEPTPRLPLEIGAARLAAVAAGQVTAIAPYPGCDVTPVLADLGLAFPAPNSMTAAGALRIVWAGREMAFLLGGPAPEGLEDLAALSDQSDGWVFVQLTGAAAREVLARVTPLDLRDAAMPVASAARTLINHMPALILHNAPQAYEIAVFRSMAATLVEELEAAMTAVAARAELTA